MPTGLATPPPCSPTPPVAARRAAALGAHREAAAQYARALRFADGLDPAALADVAPALGGRLDQLLREEAPREVLFRPSSDGCGTPGWPPYW